MKRRLIGIVFIVIGLSIIGSALFMRYSADRRQKAMMNAFENTLESIDKDLSEDRGDQSAGRISEASPGAKPPSEEVNSAIGIMKIPKIDLKVAVAEGIDDETLKYAVGHFVGTAMPGEKGNFSVAGHRSYTYSEYFNRLDEVSIGDDIIVKTKNGEFTYKVYEKKVVEPTEVSVLDKTKDATITLVTCTPIRVATHRLIVKGRLQ